MKIHALGELQRLFEVAIGVALDTFDTGVLPCERVLGGGVIEVLADGSSRNPLPSRSVMTGLATLRKTAVMRIAVTIHAFTERNASIARLIVRSRGMTSPASYFSVKSGQRIARFGVIEFLYIYGLPVVVVVALQAIGPEACFVLVFMTGHTRWRQAEEGTIQVRNLDESLVDADDMTRSVTAAAFKP